MAMNDDFRTDIIENMPYDEYDKVKAASQSILRRFGRSPAHAKWAIDHPSPSTAAMVLGNAVHCRVLRPSDYEKEYVVLPEFDGRTKEGKELKAKFETDPRVKLKADEGKYVESITEKLLANRALSRMIDGSQRELSVFWQDRDSGVQCKGRLDSWQPATGTILDIKTTIDGSPFAFSNSLAKLGYLRQAAWYWLGLEHNKMMVKDFVFAVVEKDPPFCVALYTVNSEDLTTARNQNMQALSQYRFCTQSNTWPGYPADPQELRLPKWARDPNSISTVEEY